MSVSARPHIYMLPQAAGTYLGGRQLGWGPTHLKHFGLARSPPRARHLCTRARAPPAPRRTRGAYAGRLRGRLCVPLGPARAGEASSSGDLPGRPPAGLGTHLIHFGLARSPPRARALAISAHGLGRMNIYIYTIYSQPHNGQIDWSIVKFDTVNTQRGNARQNDTEHRAQ